jgi:hypothetical protein
MPASNKKVLFILSTNYAGSHYLSLLVGSHSRATHIGEIHRFRNEQIHKEPCFSCGDYRKCPVFRGIEPGRIHDIHETVFRNLRPEIDLLVDNSKKSSWAANFIGHAAFESRLIHLIRDPRALIRRWDMGYDTPGKRWHQRQKLLRRMPGRAISILTARPRLLYVYKWLEQNRRFTDFLGRNRLEHQLMTYRDLATNTAAEVEGLMKWLGLKFEPGQIEYWNFEHHGTQKSEYEWIKQKKGSYFDTRWKSYLTEQEQLQIIEHPLVQRYLAELNICANDEGLTKLAPVAARETRKEVVAPVG